MSFADLLAKDKGPLGGWLAGRMNDNGSAPAAAAAAATTATTSNAGGGGAGDIMSFLGLGGGATSDSALGGFSSVVPWLIGGLAISQFTFDKDHSLLKLALIGGGIFAAIKYFGGMKHDGPTAPGTDVAPAITPGAGGGGGALSPD